MAMIVIPRRVPWRRKPPSIGSAQFNRKWLKSPNGFFLPLADGAGAPRDVLANRSVTINGATWTTTKAGRGLSFDEVNDDVQVADFSYGPNFLIGVELSAADNSGGAFQYYFSHGAVTTANSVNIYIGESSEPSFADKFLVNYRDNDDADAGTLISSSSWISGKIFRIFFRTNAAGGALFINGTKEASDATHGGGSFNPSGNIFIGARQDLNAARYFGGVINWTLLLDGDYSDAEVEALSEGVPQIFAPRTQRIFIPSGALSLSSAATLRDGDKPIATQQKAVSVDALIRAADLLIGTQQKSLSVDAILADADKLSTASRHEATLATQLLDGDVSIASAQKAGSISGLLQDADKATGISSKAALVTGLLLDGDLLTALGSQSEAHQSAAVLSGADVLIAGVTTNRTVSGKAQDGDTLTVASAISRVSAALGIEPETLTSASTSARSIGALIVEGDAAIAGIQSGRLQPALLIDGDILIIASSTVAQADLAGKINLSGRYAPQVSLVGVYAPAINLKGRVH